MSHAYPTTPKFELENGSFVRQMSVREVDLTNLQSQLNTLFPSISLTYTGIDWNYRVTFEGSIKDIKNLEVWFTENKHTW